MCLIPEDTLAKVSLECFDKLVKQYVIITFNNK